MESFALAFTDQQLWLLGFGTLVGVGLFARGFGLWRRRRAIEDTPTAKVRSMALGRVELKGVARARELLRAPLSGIGCVWFRYRIERESGSGRRRRWQTVDSGDSSDRVFELEDETGRVLVEPKGATIEIDAQLKETDPPLVGELERFVAERGVRVSGLFGTARLRITEARLHDGDTLYLHGVAQARPGLREERRRAISMRLAELKSDEKEMVALDVDGDGAVSADEWDAARVRVVSEVDGRSIRDAVVVAIDPLGHAPFLLAAHPETVLVRKLALRATASVFGGAALALVCLHFWIERLAALGRI